MDVSLHPIPLWEYHRESFFIDRSTNNTLAILENCSHKDTLYSRVDKIWDQDGQSPTTASAALAPLSPDGRQQTDCGCSLAVITLHYPYSGPP